ncbi:unnamed protein product [Blepharisma stoltei]|uniref:Uncharacterized protein n=1 Tax=Blepharisma stoltei TaxID=1481888 RepID=A0AAU9IQ06_9CILI|nr:unnamed protein product [Blepharisma stoltei]
MRMMGNFGGSFWATFRGFQSPSRIDEILESEETTLTQVLDEEEVLQEMRNQNQKLIDFLNRDRILELIEYITIFPPEGCDNRRGHKFPFLASELFACETASLLDKFFADQELLEKLFNFFTTESLNLTLAGYASKLIISLFIRNPSEMLKFIIENSWNTWLLDHSEYKAIADIINRIVLVENLGDPFYIPQRKEIIQKLINNLASENPNAAFHSSQILCDLTNKPTEVNSWAELAGVIMQKESLNKLIEGLTADSTHNINAVVTVLRSIMTSSSRSDLLTLNKKPDEDSATILEDEESPEFIESFIQVLPKLKEILENVHNTQILTVFNEDIESLGEGKIKIIEVLYAAIKMEIKEIQAKIEEIEVVRVIVGLFFNYEWNSILHATFEQFANAVLASSSQALKEQLLKTSGFLNKMIEKGLNPTRPGTRNPSLRPGYMGYITKISNSLIKLSETHSEIAEILLATEKWAEYKSSYLEDRNFIENRHLGGYKPLSFGDHFADEDSKAEENSKNPFSSYTNNENANEDLEIPEEEIETTDKPLTNEDLMFDLTENEDKKGENNEPESEREQVRTETHEENQMEPDIYSDVNYWAPPVNVEDLEEL